MTEDVLQALKSHFGFDRFLPGQEQVIEHLLAGKSAAAVFPTGGGKSLCYQLPALVLPGVTLVVSPLIALMKDQIDSLTRRGIAAARLDSTLSADEYNDTMQRARAGSLRLLYVAPERFQNERFRHTIGQIQVALFAVDEAHCISEWGHNFRPDYLKLVEFARQCRAERMLALTATATPQVLDDVCKAFDIAPECAIRNSCYRPNLTVLTTQVDAQEHEPQLIDRIRKRPPGPTIVYVTLQRTAEELAARLSREGLLARPYHAGLDDAVRAATQDWFMRSTNGIVVATIAFGMGIDKADIRYVYHFNLPKSLENYAQEIGRAGRDGLPGTCEMLLCLDDLGQLENFAVGDTPTIGAVERLVDDLFESAPGSKSASSHVTKEDAEFDVSFYELSGQCDIRPLVVRTLMTYLELDGFLAGGTPFYSSYRFQPIKTSKEILAEFEGERREFLQRLLRLAKKAKTWFSIDLDQAARSLDTARDRIVRALDYLGERGWLKLDVSGARNRYRRLKIPVDRAALAESLHARCVHRERRELARLAQVVELANQPTCQVAALCHHFGEERTERCGHCTRCLNPSAAPPVEPSSGDGNSDGDPHVVDLSQRPTPPLDETILREALALRPQYEALADPVVMARWLCGIPSPALSKCKLSSHRLFGSLGDQPLLHLRERLATEFRGPAKGA